MTRRRTSPIDRKRSNWHRLWGEPIGWVWLSAFLLHLVALLWIQDFVWFEGRSADEHGIFMVQSMRFSAVEKHEKEKARLSEVDFQTELTPAATKNSRLVPEKKIEEVSLHDLPQWNPLLRHGAVQPNLENQESVEVGGGYSGVKIWDLQSAVKRVVFLIDVSGTMWNEMEGKWGFQVAQEEVIRSIKALPQEISFNVIYYSDTISMMTPTLVPATRENKEFARRFLKMKPNLSGATDFFKGIQGAFEQHPEAVFIFTDGEMDVPRWKVPSQFDRLKEQYGGSIALFGIGFFYEKNQESLDVLQKLCFISGGDYKLYLPNVTPVKIEKKSGVK